MPTFLSFRSITVLLTIGILIGGCGKLQLENELAGESPLEEIEFILDSNFRSVTSLEPQALTETTLSCFSAGGKRTNCGYSKRLVKARVLEKYPGAPCSAGKSFGIDSNSGTLWADQGCRAKFAIFFVAAKTWQNSNRYDVNDDGFVNSQDRLDLIGELNRRTSLNISYELGVRPAQLLGSFWDINGDKLISTKDVLDFDNYTKNLKCPNGAVEDKGTCLLIKPYVSGMPWYSKAHCEQMGLSLAYLMDTADCEKTAKDRLNLFGYPSLGTCIAAENYNSSVQYMISRCNLIR